MKYKTVKQTNKEKEELEIFLKDYSIAFSIMDSKKMEEELSRKAEEKEFER